MDSDGCADEFHGIPSPGGVSTGSRNSNVPPVWNGFGEDDLAHLTNIICSDPVSFRLVSTSQVDV